MKKSCAVILAGGEGTRMKSNKPKVMDQVLFRPMLSWVIDAARDAGIEDILVVTDYKSEIMEEYLAGSAETAKQHPGTGHAVMQAMDFIIRHSGADVLILNGDAPLIDAKTISDSHIYHTKGNFVQTVISARVENPFGYGRIVRDKNGKFTAIAEEASADEKIKRINEINSGAIWFDCDALVELLKKITSNNSMGEYYLTDTVELALSEGKKVGAYTTDNSDAVLDANSGVQLFKLNEKLRMRTLEKFMLEGVAIPCADGVIIDPTAKIGNNTVILPGTIIKEGCIIGNNCIIGPSSVLYKTVVGNGTTLNNVQSEKSTIADNVTVGPFAHIRPGTNIENGVHIGNFVEVKNSSVGKKTSISHLTYVGDSDVGKGVNFGCGVVTVNFNGKEKNRCTIEDDAFIGCNTNLIAPVNIGKRAYTAAGSTITEDVPEDALSIARQRQINKENWVKEKKPYREKNIRR